MHKFRVEDEKVSALHLWQRTGSHLRRRHDWSNWAKNFWHIHPFLQILKKSLFEHKFESNKGVIVATEAYFVDLQTGSSTVGSSVSSLKGDYFEKYVAVPPSHVCVCNWWVAMCPYVCRWIWQVWKCKGNSGERRVAHKFNVSVAKAKFVSFRYGLRVRCCDSWLASGWSFGWPLVA